jgi:flagella basal body P-ring formation protein FlgA
MVTLIWEQGDMHIARRVICLDPGGKDQEVRTRSKEGGRVMRARVMAAGVVKAI